MSQDATSVAQRCVFCAIGDRQVVASVVFEDETVVVFMDLNPVTPGHLLVVPRKHAVGLEDLDAASSAHVWSVGHDMARALRRSSLGCEGINVLVCDGEVAFQTVFHFHLHVIPRYPGDGLGQPFKVEPQERARSLRDRDARAIKVALPSAD
jgi:histidine triad (HIT) family protein